MAKDDGNAGPQASQKIKLTDLDDHAATLAALAEEYVEFVKILVTAGVKEVDVQAYPGFKSALKGLRAFNNRLRPKVGDVEREQRIKKHKTANGNS